MELERTFLALHRLVTADLCTLGKYDAASDNDDDGYDELYLHAVKSTPIYVLRKSVDTCTLVVSAQDYCKKDIEINSEADWAIYRLLITEDGGLPLETVLPEEAGAEDE